MPIGRLRVKEKDKGTLSRFIILPGQIKVPIPLTFVITLEMDGQACEYQVNDKGVIAKITVGGKEVTIDNDLLLSREKKQQKQAEQEEKRKQEEREERKKGQRNSGQAPIIDYAFSPATFSRLPKDVRLVLDKPDNLYLRIFKAANFWKENQDKDTKRDKATLFQIKRGNKKLNINDQLMQHLPTGKQDYGSFPFQKHVANQWSTIQALYPQQVYHYYRTQNRLVTGIGGATVFEVGFTLHHVFGFPYLPASSIKGITRSCYIQQNFAGSEAAALKDQTFCDLFGCPAEWIEKREGNPQVKHPSWYALNKQFSGDKGERKGAIIFFDAYPLQAPQVEDEVMNVHYPKYYQGKSMPTDSQLPVPIAFLAVAAHTTFQFTLATDSQDINARTLLQKVEDTLHAALTEHGIGAKTAVGYGLMEKV